MVAGRWNNMVRMMCAVASGLVLLSAVGCVPAGLPEVLTPYDLANDPDGDGSLETARPVEWSDGVARATGGISIDSATMVQLVGFLGAEIIGEVRAASEVDVYALGPLDAGDQIDIEVRSLVQAIANLTPLADAEIVRNGAGMSLMLVDADAEILGFPAAAPVVVDSTGDYFLVVQSSAPGDYDLTIHRLRDRPAPPARPGVCLLQFGGGTDLGLTFLGDSELIRIDDLPAFELEQARPDLPGQTQRFQETVRQIVEYIYADYDMLVTLDADVARSADVFDTLVFTTASPETFGWSAETLGIEPSIDVENQGGQAGVVFMKNDGLLHLDFNSFAAAWAVVAAHEIGHALGLYHVRQEAQTLMAPSLTEPDHPRYLKPLSVADKQETVTPSIRLVQNPDRYLSRVLGRRDTAEADAIRERTRTLLSLVVQP